MFSDAIVWYLFLGGGGAAMAATLAAFDLAFWRHKRRPNRFLWTRQITPALMGRGLGVATVALGLGALCLLVDIGRPERFYYVLTHPTQSVLTFGAFALSITALCTAALAAIALFKLTRVPPPLVSSLEIGAIVSGICTAAYTGVFLMQMDFLPFWNNPVLPLLFVASALSVGLAGVTGCALVSGETPREYVLAACTRFDRVAIVAEAACLFAYLAIAALQHGPQAVASFILGPLAPLFWIGCVGAGIVAPIALETFAMRRGLEAFLGIAASCVLIGGFFLRYCIVNAPFPLPL